MVRDYQDKDLLDKKVADNSSKNIPSSEKKEAITQGNSLLESLKKLSIGENIEEAFTLITSLEKNVKNYPNIDELFYQLIEGFSIILHSQESFGNFEIINAIMEKILLKIKSALENNDYLAALCDIFILTLETFVTNDFVEDTEEYIKFITKLSIKHPNNMIIKTTAADSIIIVQSGFGSEWNYEKCLEYGKLLRTLLPPLESKGIFAGILLKGLAEEIDLYGDMNEFSELNRSLELMRKIFLQNKDCKFDVITNYSVGLIKALKWFGELEQIENMSDTLFELDELTKITSCPEEVKLSFTHGLSVVLDLTSIIENYEITFPYVKKMLSIADEFPKNDEIQNLALTSILKVAIWASNHWETGILFSLLNGLRTIARRQLNNTPLLEQYSRGLFLITQELSQIGNEKILQQILDELELIFGVMKTNDIIAFNFSQAIINMTYLLGEISDSIDLMKSYVTKQKKLFEMFADNDDFALNYSKTLVNAIRMTGLVGEIELMEEYLDSLRDFTFSKENRSIFIRFGKGSIDAIKAYGEIGDLERIPQLINELEDIADEDYGDIELQINLVKAIVNAISSYAKNDLLIDMTVYYDKLRELSFEYEGINEIQKLFANGIALLIKAYIKSEDLIQIKTHLEEIIELSNNYQKNEKLQVIYTRSLRRALVFMQEKNNQNYSLELLDQIRTLINKFPLNEDIQIEFARAIAHFLISQNIQRETNEWKSLVMEIKGLHIQFTENEKLNRLYTTILPFIND